MGDIEIHMADDVFIKSISVPRAGTVLEQHQHKYNHTSMIAAGAVSVWVDGKHRGDYTAPSGVLIEAGRNHFFRTLVDHTLIYCIHNLARSEVVEVLDGDRSTSSEGRAVRAMGDL